MTATAPQTAAGPTTATGTAPPNVAGQAIAITVFSTCRWWARPYLTALFWYSRLRPSSRAKLADLSFIHFARWTLVKRLPGQRLRYAHLFFESNFNGGWEEYIDAFSHILTKGMKKFWGSSYGYPGALPTAPFKAYIRRNEVERQPLLVRVSRCDDDDDRERAHARPRLARFTTETAGMDDEAFAAAWRSLLTETQGWL